MLFKTATNRWLKQHKHLVKPSTYALYEYTITKYILPYFEQTSLEDISNDVIQQYVFYLFNDLRLDHKTIQNIIINLKQILNFCFECKYCKQFYIKTRLPKVTKIKQVSVFSNHDILKLKSYLINNITHMNIGILIALYGGLRIGEVCGLTWGDIDFKARTINIDKTVQRIYYIHNNQKRSRVEISTPKTISSIRTIPMHKDLYDVLKQLKSDSDNYLLSNKKTPIEPRCFRKHYQKILKECKVEFKKFHTLRHTFATRLINKGADAKVVSEILGHSKVTTTLDLYVHPSIKNMRRVVNYL